LWKKLCLGRGRGSFGTFKTSQKWFGVKQGRGFWESLSMHGKMRDELVESRGGGRASVVGLGPQGGLGREGRISLETKEKTRRGKKEGPEREKRSHRRERETEISFTLTREGKGERETTGTAELSKQALEEGRKSRKG